MRAILLIMIGLSSMLSADFTRDANGIVTDNTTGLAWQDNAIGSPATWQEAINRCEALSLGGEDDWRLPNLNELNSLVDDTKYNPIIDDVFQDYTASNIYWSSTTPAVGHIYVWTVDLSSGNQNVNDKNLNCYVRCVRAGR